MGTLPMTKGTGFSGFGPALQRWLDDKINGTDRVLEEVADEIAKGGETSVKGFIETRGTPKSGKRGRIETGEMRDAVSHRTTKVARSQHRAEFGWIDKTPGWAVYQEHGFTHVNGGKVAGMYSLSDASEIAREEARRKLKEKLNGL